MQNLRPPRRQNKRSLEAVPSSLEVPRVRKSHLLTSVWISGWYVYIFFSPPTLHMHTFTVQGCSVCNQRLCFFFFFYVSRVRGQTCLSRDRPQVTTHENRSYSQWCHIVDFSRRETSYDGPSVTRKSHLSK